MNPRIHPARKFQSADEATAENVNGESSVHPVASDIENDREFKAHVYQQLIELQPYLSPDSQVSVLVAQEDDVPEDIVSLSLVATLGEYRLECDGQDEDMYRAFSIAKQKMLEQLEEWYSQAVDTTDRDNEVQAFIEGRATVH